MADKEIQLNRSYKIIDHLKPIFYLQAIFGYDYGLFGQKVTWKRQFIKYASTSIVILLISSIIILDLIHRSFYWYLMYPIQYGIEALLTIYRYGPKVRENFKRYDEIDEKLKIEDKYYKRMKIWMCVYIFSFLLLTSSYITSFTSGFGLRMTCSFLFVLDISFILRLLFLDLILYRIKRLRIFIERSYGDDLKIIECGKKPLCIDFKLHMSIYKSLADQLDDFNNCAGFLFALSFVMSLLKFIVLLHDVTSATSDSGKSDIYFMIMSISLAVHTVVILGWPGYFGEKTLWEVEKIKLILADELVKNYGLEKEGKIRNFIEYIRIRPMSLTAFGAIPVNVKLISVVLNFCVTILILLWQFPLSPVLSFDTFVQRSNKNT